MADYQAVALGIKPPDPNQPFESMGNILGLQQKRQALGIQAQQLAQEKIATQQAQNYSQFTQDFDPASHIGPDGTLDVAGVRASDAYKNAGNAKPLVDEYIQKVQTGQLQNKQALQNLDNDTLTNMSRGVGALANDKDVLADNAAGRAKVDNFYKLFSQESPQNARISGIFGGVVQHAKQGDLSDAVYAQQLMAADVLGQRGQQNPVRGTNAAGQATIANARTGLTALAPTTGGGDVNPSTPAVSESARRGAGQADADTDRANQVSASIQPSKAAIGLTQRVDDLAEQIKSGKFAKYIMDRAAAIGVSDPSVVARQLLEKDLGQVRNAASASAATDKKMETVLSGYPEATSATDTIHGAMDYIRGSFRQNVARGALLNSYREKNPKLNGFQHADDVLTGSTDPLMHEFKALQSPAERIAFYKRNFSDPAKAQEFKNRVAGVSHATGQ